MTIYTYRRNKLLIARPVLVLSTDLEQPRTLSHHKIDRDNCLYHASRVFNVIVNICDDRGEAEVLLANFKLRSNKKWRRSMV